MINKTTYSVLTCSMQYTKDAVYGRSTDCSKHVLQWPKCCAGEINFHFIRKRSLCTTLCMGNRCYYSSRHNFASFVLKYVYTYCKNSGIFLHASIIWEITLVLLKFAFMSSFSVSDAAYVRNTYYPAAWEITLYIACSGCWKYQHFVWREHVYNVYTVNHKTYEMSSSHLL